MKKEYSVIWKTFQAFSDLGKQLGAEKDFSFPYFIDGDDKEKFEEGTLNNLTEIHLLRGLLVGYFDNPPTIDTNYSKTLFPNSIEDLRIHFNVETTEKLILDIASFIRRENGDYASHIVLRTGLELIPNNSKIRFDLCSDLYNMLGRKDYKQGEQGINLLKENLEKINIDDIRPEFIEYLTQFKEFIGKKKIEEKEKLINYVSYNNRVCPQPQLWNKLWEKLKDKERVGSAGWNPPVPLILAAWWDSSDNSKKQRLIEHLNWAEKKGQLDEIGSYIYKLTEEEWFHTNE
jgi:hypothetical protein